MSLRHRSSRSRPICVLIALLTSGRFSVTTSTCSLVARSRERRRSRAGSCAGLHGLAEDLGRRFAERRRSGARHRAARRRTRSGRPTSGTLSPGIACRMPRALRLRVLEHLPDVLHRRARHADRVERRDPVGVRALHHLGLDQGIERSGVHDPLGVGEEARIVRPFRMAERPRTACDRARRSPPRRRDRRRQCDTRVYGTMFARPEPSRPGSSPEARYSTACRFIQRGGGLEERHVHDARPCRSRGGGRARRGCRSPPTAPCRSR